MFHLFNVKKTKTLKEDDNVWLAEWVKHQAVNLAYVGSNPTPNAIASLVHR